MCIRDSVGIEALSGIPGFVGATPVQNVGAYGQEVAGVIARVRTWDRQRSAVRTFSAIECGFGYRDSLFKREPGRWVVLSVSFQFRLGQLSAPIGYAELAKKLDVEIGQRAPLAAVRDAVLELRRAKGMVYDRADHDSWSAGSFFTNPVLDELTQVPDGAPAFPQPDGRVKTSAAWLIEHAGFGKGWGDGPAQLSTKHTLALTNRGQARAADVVALARHVRAGVEDAFGIRLVPEPILVGVSLDSDPATGR
jgi:UDP-N-acetylmuramate dehydrogenase